MANSTVLLIPVKVYHFWEEVNVADPALLGVLTCAFEQMHRNMKSSCFIFVHDKELKVLMMMLAVTLRAESLSIFLDKSGRGK